MFRSQTRGTALVCRRLAAAVLLLAFLFLPLHLHYSTASQLSKECSCAHGNRTQLGLAPAALDWIPGFQLSPVVYHELEALGRLSTSSHTIRAPPSVYSL